MLRPGTSPGSYIAVDLMTDGPTPSSSSAGSGQHEVSGAASQYVDDGFGPASMAFLCTDASPAKRSTPNDRFRHDANGDAAAAAAGALRGSVDRLRHASSGSATSVASQRQQNQTMTPGQTASSSSSCSPRQLRLSSTGGGDVPGSIVQEMNKRSNLILNNVERGRDYGTS